MSNYVLDDLGEGRFAVKGEMSFSTANTILRASEGLFAQHDSLQIDLSGVERTDSAGLALLLEWKSQALGRNADIRFDGVPDNLLAIARTTEAVDLI